MLQKTKNKIKKTYSTIMFMLAAVKKLAQNIGTSNSGLAKAAKSKTYTNFQTISITEKKQ